MCVYTSVARADPGSWPITVYGIKEKARKGCERAGGREREREEFSLGLSPSFSQINRRNFGFYGNLVSLEVNRDFSAATALRLRNAEIFELLFYDRVVRLNFELNRMQIW